VPNAVVSKTIIKTTGNITVSSFAFGEELAEKTYPYDTYFQIIDGTAEVIISSFILSSGIAFATEKGDIFVAHKISSE
jgi:hypothetical protein